jgi:hypothetical protein
MMVSDCSGVDGELGKMATVRACVFTTDGKGQKSWPAGGTPSDLHGAHGASSAATRWKGWLVAVGASRRLGCILTRGGRLVVV